VFETLPQDNAFRFLDRAQLVKLKLKAMRSGAWFKALRRIDRVLIDLTIKVARTVRSVTLAKSILALARKLEGIMESGFSRALRQVGFQRARKLSLVAQEWGNLSANEWPSDQSFASFLAVLSINEPKTFGL
jgi:hypothetical protein